jgi:hypothetical protein
MLVLSIPKKRYRSLDKVQTVDAEGEGNAFC